MVSLEQKERNRQYILNHLDEYTIDVKGNFFSINPEYLGSGENSDYAYIGVDNLTPEGNQEIREKMGEMILQKVED
jgi:hypothetical protein